MKRGDPLNGMAICSGIGGLELGLQLALPSYRTVCHVEGEAYAAHVLVARMEDQVLAPAPVWDDVTTFNGRDWRGVVDIISTGFPCQPWSCAGARRGTRDPRWLWPHIRRVIGEVGPPFVFLENVPGILTGGLPHILGALAEMGYDAEWGCFSAAEVGAPHLRVRWFLLAHAHGSGQPPTLPDVLGGEPHPLGGPGGHGEAEDALCDGPQENGEGKGNLPAARQDGELAGPDRWLPEPEVPRVDDGTPRRVDRIRACGNAVVPQVAARAFIELLKRLEMKP